jgi:prevent-host-death family protein
MKQVSFTEFRKNAAAYFNSVERGEAIQVLRHGRPIADIVPAASPKTTLSWKLPGLKLEIPGISLRREILKERKQTTR